MTCNCSVDWYDQPELYRVKTITARKPHRCCECHQEIAPGQRYELVDGKWAGQWGHFATCEPCARIRDDYCPDGSVLGELAETIMNCLGFDYRRSEKP